MSNDVTVKFSADAGELLAALDEIKSRYRQLGQSLGDEADATKQDGEALEDWAERQKEAAVASLSTAEGIARLASAKNASAEALRQAGLDQASVDEQLSRRRIESAEKTNAQMGELGSRSSSERIDELVRLKNQEYDLDQASLQNKEKFISEQLKSVEQCDNAEIDDKRKVYSDYMKSLANFNDQEKLLLQKHNEDISKLNNQRTAASIKEWQHALAPIDHAFSTSINGIIRGTTTLQQAGHKAAQSLLLSFAQAAEKSLTKWIATELGMTAATNSGNLQRTASNESAGGGFLSGIGTQLAEWLGLETSKTAATTAEAGTRSAEETTATSATIAAAKVEAAGEIPAYASIAAAAAMASVAAIPVIGWALAPEIGEATFAEAMAFLPMASAEGGWDRVPFDGALTELHKDEMVLPASIANSMRAMATGYGPPSGLAAPGPLSLSPAAGTASGGSGTGGGDSYHITIQAMDASSVANLFQRQGSALVKSLNRQIANGATLASKV